MTVGLRLGIDIGGTKVELTTIDHRGVIVRSHRVATQRGADAVLDLLSSLIDPITRDLHQPLVGIGIGIPGVVEWDTGRVLHAVNIGIEDLELGKLIEGRFGVPTRVDNDVNAAALGAAHVEGREHRSIGYLNLGTGMAAGIIIDGRVWRGAGGVVGEIGHVPVDPGQGRCPCGQLGCLELKASGSALARALPEGVSPADVSAGMLAEDPAVRGVFNAWVESVAEAVRMLALSVGVERVVIGGGAATFGGLLLEPLRAVLARWGDDSPFIASLDLPSRTTLIEEGSLASYGAALLIDVGDSIRAHRGVPADGRPEARHGDPTPPHEPRTLYPSPLSTRKETA